MTNRGWLMILAAVIVVGAAVAYLPLQTAAEVMAGVIVIGTGVMGYLYQGPG